MVFSEDVAELIHPITMPGNTFKLVTTILSLLKVPLLPCRQTTMTELGLDYVPWALDSVETLVSIFLPMYPVDIGNDLLKYTQKLAVGPQYLKALPCQEEYLEFVLKIMQNSFEALLGEEKTSLAVWWFRFIRLLVSLERDETFRMSERLKKRMKSDIKNVLKQEEFRNNPLFFCEYAFYELTNCRRESAIKVLLTTIEVNYKNANFGNVKMEDRTVYCHTYRSLVEISSITCDFTKVKQYLMQFIMGESTDTSTDKTREASLKFKHYQSLLHDTLEKPKVVEHFTPNLFVDFTILHGWFLYITEGVLNAGVFLESVLENINERFNNENLLWKEVVFEFYVTLLLKNCIEHPGTGIFRILDDVLYRGIEAYPNNLYMLSVLLKLHTMNRSLSQKWWRIKSMILKSGRALPVLFLVLILNQHVNEVEELQLDTITGQKIVGSSNLKNRMLSLFRQITSGGCTKRCGLIWRLYLQFLHAHSIPKKLRDAYYVAVEELPWLKVSFMVLYCTVLMVVLCTGVVYRCRYLYTSGITTNSRLATGKGVEDTCDS